MIAGIVDTASNMAIRKMYASKSKESCKAKIVKVKVKGKVKIKVQFMVKVRISHMGQISITEDPTGIVRADLRFMKKDV